MSALFNPRTLPPDEPQNSHFFSLFGVPGVISRLRSSISKLFLANQIGLDMRSSLASKTPCGTSNPKFSFRFLLIVHHLGGSGQYAEDRKGLPAGTISGERSQSSAGSS